MMKNCVGIDVGRFYTKVVEVETKKELRFVRTAFKERTPKEVFADGKIDGGVLSGFLGEVFSSHEVKNRNVAIALSSSDVITKVLKIPIVDKNELPQSVLWEAEQYISTGLDDVNVDFQIVSTDEQKGEYTIVLSAAKKETIESFASAFKLIKKKLKVVDVDVFALANSFQMNHPDVVGDDNLLIDVGFSSTKLIFIRGNIPYFSRFVDFGFKEAVDDVSRSMNISHERMEFVFKNVDALSEGEKNDLLGVLKAFLHPLYRHIKSSVDFYYSSVSKGASQIKRTVFSGALGCMLEYLREDASVYFEEMGEIVRFNPFNALIVEDRVLESEDVKGSVSSLYGIAVGLALRKA